MRDDQYVLNNCTPYLARSNSDFRHNFGSGHYPADDRRGRIREAWRFPVIDTCSAAPEGAEAGECNDVTFVYAAFDGAPGAVSVVGSFAPLHAAVALRRVLFLGEPTAYFAVTVAVPRRQAFRYRFFIDGESVIDPINPQTVRADNGALWSRFFTWEHSEPLVFERWELAIVKRLCDHILPFRTRAGERFFSWYYKQMDESARRGALRRAYRFDDSAGAASFIDHLLAREEAHHLIDYKLCLREIAAFLRRRDPQHEPADTSKDHYEALYGQLAANAVDGWNMDRYGNPAGFLQLLRRHALTGAFSHPKYGGNASAAGWSYLDRELAPTAGGSIFDYEAGLEPPLGRNAAYLG